MMIRKFWPLDYDPEGEIYENVAWDLPGYRTRTSTQPPSSRKTTTQNRRGKNRKVKGS